jgi:hypothetical protein
MGRLTATMALFFPRGIGRRRRRTPTRAPAIRPGCQNELTNSYTLGPALRLALVSLLHKPDGKDELPIDLDSGPCLTCQRVMIGGAAASRNSAWFFTGHGR